jgi:hypothetical protein
MRHQRQNETVFNMIYRLAAEHNEEALREIVQDGLSLNVCQSLYPPVLLLAQENNTAGVQILRLLGRENIRDYAVWGYAISGHRGF